MRIERRRQGPFLYSFYAVMLLLVMLTPYSLASSEAWSLTGPILLFFGLLTLVNAPFDWFAIGLTRALLRRGLAPGGWGPYVYSVIDLLVSILVIGVLAIVATLAVQTFDAFAVRGGGPAAGILPLRPLFDGLEHNPSDPELWWVWAMLFSTLIPSLLNLCVGAAAMLRGFPLVNDWIWRRMPEGIAMRPRDRLIVASALAGHIAGGVLLTGFVAYGLFVALVPLGLPTVGGWILGIAEQVEAYHAPVRLMDWFALKPGYANPHPPAIGPPPPAIDPPPPAIEPPKNSGGQKSLPHTLTRRPFR